jgi:hypothetical protein
METLSESTNTGAGGFIKHVFNFDSESKAEILNIIQYALLALVPIIVLNKVMQKYIPEADDEKSSIEILAEVIVQILIIILGLFFIDRLVTFVPTYSTVKHVDFSVTTIVLVILLILLSLQTKLGEKVSILFDRVTDLWNGGERDEEPKSKKSKGKGSVKVSQPISVRGQTGQSEQGAQAQSLYGGSTPISQLPTSQQLPDYNSMYNQADQNPLQNANTPGFGGMEILAANEALGGSAFGSNF